MIWIWYIQRFGSVIFFYGPKNHFFLTIFRPPPPPQGGIKFQKREFSDQNTFLTIMGGGFKITKLKKNQFSILLIKSFPGV